MEEIKYPDLETRLAIIQSWTKIHDLFLIDDVKYMLATFYHRSIRELEGALIKLSAITTLTEKEIDVTSAKDILDIKTTEQIIPKVILPEDILQKVAPHFSVFVADIKSESRKKETVLARQITAYFFKRQLSLTLNDIGEILGNRNHTTILHSLGKITKELKRDAELRQVIEVLGCNFN